MASSIGITELLANYFILIDKNALSGTLQEVLHTIQQGFGNPKGHSGPMSSSQIRRGLNEIMQSVVRRETN